MLINNPAHRKATHILFIYYVFIIQRHSAAKRTSSDIANRDWMIMVPEEPLVSTFALVVLHIHV